MELRHLRYFLAVAELGTVTAAAERFYVAQPAISRQLHRLERDLGIALFTRRGPRLTLTDAGRRFVDVAVDIVTRADRAAMVAQQMAHGELTRCSVAAASTTIEYVLAPFVATLSPEDPLFTVDEVTEDIHEAVLSGRDLGLAATAPPADRLAWRRLTSVPLRAYVNAGHAWADRREVLLRELVEEPLLVPAPNDPTRHVFDQALTRSNLQYVHYEEVAWPPLSQAFAAAGRGVSIVTDLERFGAHALLVIDDEGDPVPLHIHACWDRDHYAAPALERLADRLAVFSDTVVRQAAEEI